MNLIHCGGTREPVRMLQYMRLLRESGEDSEKLLKAVFDAQGVRTQAAFKDLRFVFSMFVLQGCTGYTLDHLREMWPGIFLARPQPLGDEVHDITWHVSWKQLFERCYRELAGAAMKGGPGKGLYEQLDFKLANAAATLIFNTYKGAQALFEDYSLFRQEAMETHPRCKMCKHFAGQTDDTGRCQHFRFLTGEERICKKFRPARANDVA